MAIDDKIRDKKQQHYDIKREVSNLSVLSPGKIDKYEYPTGQEILPADQTRAIEQTKFKYIHLGKAFEKQIKAIEDQGRKKVKTLKLLNPEDKKINSIEGIFPKTLNNSIIRNKFRKAKEQQE